MGSHGISRHSHGKFRKKGGFQLHEQYCRRGNIGIVELLIEKGIDINQTNKYGCNALQIAYTVLFVHLKPPLFPDFFVGMTGNPMTAHDMTGLACRFPEKSGNKWTLRDLTGLPIPCGN